MQSTYGIIVTIVAVLLLVGYISKSALIIKLEKRVGMLMLALRSHITEIEKIEDLNSGKYLLFGSDDWGVLIQGSSGGFFRIRNMDEKVYEKLVEEGTFLIPGK